MNSRQNFRYSNVVLDNDVICGRGGASNKHKGNIFFRELVTKHKENYLASSKAEKKHIAKFIVDTIRRNGGRFLKLDHPMELTDVGDISAMEKTCQALREGLKIRANKKKPKNEEKYVPVTFTESSLSSHSQYLPASHYDYSIILRDYNMIASSQNKHNTTHGQINENNPRHNYNVNSNRQAYFHAQDIQYSNQNQNLEHNFEYKKPAQYIGRCTCKKSNCLKLHCQYFANLVHCYPEDCRCTNCYNSVHCNELAHQAKNKRAEKYSIS